MPGRQEEKQYLARCHFELNHRLGPRIKSGLWMFNHPLILHLTLTLFLTLAIALVQHPRICTFVGLLFTVVHRLVIQLVSPLPFSLTGPRLSYHQCFFLDQSKKLQQFTKLCKGDMSQNWKTVKMVLGRYYHMLNSRLALTRLAILST